jgi:ATP-dependent Clp protease ATP-binding subunit ClpC
MTFKELKEKSAPHSYCLTLDKYFPRRLRGFLKKSAAVLVLVSFFLSFDDLPLYLGMSDGFFFVFIFIYMALSFLEFFYRSMVSEGLSVRIAEGLINRNKNIDFALSSILFATNDIDVTKAFFETKIGREIMLRAGVSLEELKDYIYSERQSVIASTLNFGSDTVNLTSYIDVVYEADKSLQSFLSRSSVNKEEFIGSAAWIMETEDRKRRKERFWSRENLGAIPSIGTSWSYGVAADLGKFGVPFEKIYNIYSLDIDNGYRAKEVGALEGILERRAEANAIIIDDDEEVVRDIVARFVKRIKLGVAAPSLEHKNIIELDWGTLTATFKNKNELETELLKIFNQSVAAGNVIMYIRDLSGLVTSVKSLGINLPSLLFPYLSLPSLSLIASATNADFHFFIETVPTLLEKFERIIPAKAGFEASVEVLLEQVPSLENQYDFFFSYPSILSLVKNADRFISVGEMPGKALDMMTEIAPWAVQRKIGILREDEVSAFISEKTGIEVGSVKEKEVAKIENLEKLLHQRIIGQEEAVSGVASAIRRTRAGVGNPNRPISSFLFIGPTGVGKTEVSKALAESFFGDEKKMIRFDMTEYNGAGALSQLIGDFATGKSGLLASKVRDNPYGVLLLDEFEKASPDILDLFLQVLDEGVFTDALGKQVMCRSLIIIATSNAGSSLIWETIKSGDNLYKSKDAIINSIIKDKIFRPELLNRFDGVILFHPLQKNELQAIAKLQLQKLAKRLREQNIELVINDEIVNFLVEKGSDPQFGARSLNRAIQNEIEDLVARKIVSGEVKAGGKIEIKKKELV